MSLLLDSLRLAEDEVLHVRAEPGHVTQLVTAHPEALLEAVAGLRETPGGVVLSGRELSAFDPETRWDLGLVTASCQLGDLPGLCVLDVVLLGRRRQDRVSAWAATLGARKPRAQLADAEAAARGLAGRLGLARWLDREAIGLDDEVAALTDLARAIAAAPAALVWQRPSWLPDHVVGSLVEAVRDEQRRLGCAVIEVAAK